MKRVVLVGSTGGIGSVIYETLVNAGVETHIWDSRYGRTPYLDSVDGLIYAAGVNYLAGYKKAWERLFPGMLDVNTLSFVRLCSKLEFNPGAQIIVIGSYYASHGKENRLSYTITKHGLLGAVRVLALEMAQHKIKVNMISPSFVDTPLTRQNNSTERIKFLEEHIPLGLVPAQAVADLVLWMLEHNTHITGSKQIAEA